MNRGSKSSNPCLFFAKSVDPPKFLLKSETTTTSENRVSRFKGKLVHVNATVDFTQIVKKATCLEEKHSAIPITVSHQSLNELLSKKEIIWMTELINIQIKAEENSVIRILFRTQGPNKRQAQPWICIKNYSWSTVHCVFREIRESARFIAQIHNPWAFLSQIHRSEYLFTPLAKGR